MNFKNKPRTLSERARKRMRSAISSYADLHQAYSVRMPLSHLVWRAAPAFGFSLLVVSITGAGMTFASERSLPGDALYPVKVSIVEPAVAALKKSPEEKESWHTTVVERRLGEATELAAQERLNTKTRTQIDAALTKESKRMNALAEKYGKEGESARELALRSELEARLRAHDTILDELFEHLPKDSMVREEVQEVRKTLDREGARIVEQRRLAELLTERSATPSVEAIEAALKSVDESVRMIEQSDSRHSPLQEKVSERTLRAQKYAEYVRGSIDEGRVSGSSFVMAQEAAREAREAAIVATWGKVLHESVETHATSTKPRADEETSTE